MKAATILAWVLCSCLMVIGGALAESPQEVTGFPQLLGPSDAAAVPAEPSPDAAPPEALGSPAGGGFTYQGQLKKGGAPTSGTADFKFRLFDVATGGSPINGATQEKTGVAVTNGQFCVELNDAGQFGASAFNGEARWLEMEVRSPSGSGTYALLSPRQKLTPAPYAQYALGPWAKSGTSLYYTGGNVGVGTTSPTNPLVVVDTRNTSQARAIYGLAQPAGTATRIWGVVGQTDSAATTNVGAGVLGLASNANGNSYGVWGEADGSGGCGVFGGAYHGTGTNYGVYGYTPSANGYAGYFWGRGYFSGNVGIGVSAPTAKLEATSGADAPTISATQTQAEGSNQPAILGTHAVSAASGVGVKGVGGKQGVVGEATLAGSGDRHGGRFLASGGTFNYGAIGAAVGSTTNYGVMGDAHGGTTNIGVYGQAYGNGTNWAGYFYGDVKMDVGAIVPTVGNSAARGIQFPANPGGGSGDEAFIRYFVDSGEQTRFVIGTGNDWDDRISFWQAGSERMAIWNGNVGIGTGSPTSKLTVHGNVEIKSAATGNTVIQLGEGLDYAEGFDVSDKDRTSPGAVLVIDPDHPGKLAVSTTAYDRKVAGIAAGAKGLGSGVRLGTGRHDQDVALAGRVYCNVDATQTGVEPGDLLTTSSTPGYAMKATDHALAQGAILGKAMQKLDKGSKGQILVLVTLQ